MTKNEYIDYIVKEKSRLFNIAFKKNTSIAFNQVMKRIDFLNKELKRLDAK